MKFLKRFTFIALATSLFVAPGCKKDGDDGTDLAKLSLEFAFKVGSEDLVFGDNYEINGKMVNFEAANYYIGGLKMTQEDGTTIDLSQNYLLAGLGNSANVQGELQLSNLVTTSFFVGVDAATNMQTETDFTARPSGDPLGVQDPAMHWNWMTGYKFLRIDGSVDTDADGMPDTPIAYHLGSAAMLKNLEFNQTITIKGGDNTLTFELDVEKFFTGVDLAVEVDTHTGNNLPLAERLRDNLETSLTIN